MHIVAAFIVLALVQAFLVKAYQVPSESMQQTLDPGDRVLVNRLAYLGAEPETGDVIVFDRPESWGERPEQPWWRTAVGWVGDLIGFGPSNQHAMVKRVIGTPGDRVGCCDANGAVTVNGQALDEPYVFEDLPFSAGELDCASAPTSARCFDEIVLGDDEYLVMGDHRSNSSDSVVACRGGDAPATCVRVIRLGDVVGEAFAVAWPLNGWGRVLSTSPLG